MKISNYRYHLSKTEWERIDEVLKESLEAEENAGSAELEPKSLNSSKITRNPRSEVEGPETPKTDLTGKQKWAREQTETIPAPKSDADDELVLEDTHGSHNIGSASDSVKDRLCQ